MKKFFLLICCIVIYYNGHTQNTEDLIEKLRKTGAADKVFLHIDKNTFVPGETVFFKAYNNDPDETLLYVNLVDSHNRITEQKKLLLENGSGASFFTIPGNDSNRYFLLQAFTYGMLLADSSNSYTKMIFQENECGSYNYKKNSPLKSGVVLFPETGSVTDGIPAVFAFQSDMMRETANATGGIFDNNDSLLTGFTPYFNGIGKFELTPEKNKSYYALISFPGGSQKTIIELKYNENDVAFNVSPSNNGFAYRVRAKKKGRYQLLIEKDLELRYKAGFTVDGEEGFAKFLPDTVLKEGINHFILINDNSNKIVAERSYYNYRNTKSSLSVDISDTVTNLNELVLHFKDADPGDLSVSISAAGKDDNEMETDNYTFSDAKGLQQKEFIFSGSKDSVQQKLDLLTLTQTPGAASIAVMQEIYKKSKPDDAETLSAIGIIQDADSKRILGNLALSMILKQADTILAVIPAVTDGNGMIRFKDIIIRDSATLYFKQPSRDFPKYILKMTPPPVFSPELAETYDLIKCDPAAVNNSETLKLEKLSVAITNERNKMLQGVTVSAKTKTPQQLTEEKYVSSVFSSNVQEMGNFDFINDYPDVFSANVLSFLDNRVRVYGISNFSNLKDSEANYILDETTVDKATIISVNMPDVAIVKVMGPNFIPPVQIINPGKPTIIVYTKKGVDNNGNATVFSKINIQGLAGNKPYFNAVFDKGMLGNDQRTTLYWNPFAIPDENKILHCKLLNNNKNVLITIQGIDNNGDIIAVKKLVTIKN